MGRRHRACLVTAFSWRRGHSDRDPGHDRRGKLFLRQEVDHQDLPYNTRGGGGRGRVTGGRGRGDWERGRGQGGGVGRGHRVVDIKHAVLPRSIFWHLEEGMTSVLFNAERYGMWKVVRASL